MILLNFSHPLSPEQLARLEVLAGEKKMEVRSISTQFDPQLPFTDQVQALLDTSGISSETWQLGIFLINPPSHNLIALTLIAELHGRMGYFPAVVRLRPIAGAISPQFEIAEIINLQAVREAARQIR